MQEKPTIRIAIADDHPIMRKGICDVITAFDGFAIDVEASDGSELISSLKNTTEKPDICILDISMPNLNGYETLKEIRRNWSTMKVLVLSMFNNEFSVIKMLTNGANGFLQKNTSPRQLIRALAAIYYTGYYDSEPALKKIIDLVQHKPQLLPRITEREMEFLCHCCSELNYKEIADLMGVSSRTVEGYRNALFTKLNIKTRTGLVIYALKNGIVSINE